MISPRQNSGRSSSCFLILISLIVCAILILLLGAPASNFPSLPKLSAGEQKQLPVTSTPLNSAVKQSHTATSSKTSNSKASTSISQARPSTHAQTLTTELPKAKPTSVVQQETEEVEDGAARNMTLKANKFTPKVLLSAPRRSAAKPNTRGTLALYTVSTYSFESHTRNNEIRLFDVSSKESTLITNESKTSEPNWLDKDEVVYIRDGKNGTTEIVIASIREPTKTYIAGIAPGPVSDVVLKSLGNGKVAFLCSGRATPDGKLYNPDMAPPKIHTGMLYDSLPVRHWDRYLDETRHALWYGLLSRTKSRASEIAGRWSISTLINALEGSNLESPIDPWPGTEHFDLGPLGIAFVSKNPELDPAYNTMANFYFVPIPDFTKAPKSKPIKLAVDGLEGASNAPSFSSDGKSAVYISMRENGYEADKWRIILVQDLATSKPRVTELMKTDDGEGLWDRSPQKVVFTNNDTRLLILAEEEGKTLLYKLELEDIAAKVVPRRVTNSGHISDIVPISNDIVFLSGDSLVDSSIWSTVNPDDSETLTLVSSYSKGGAAFGLSEDQVDEIWFNGAQDRKVHAWIVKPSKNARKPPIDLKWPLALLIHGGPQSSWGDSWSTRWNPAVFAEQGYYVVMPNPTGSTGYGQDFTDAIHENWGGDPYEDIVKCYDYIKNEMSDTIDADRAVALGASYGGYMMNWIQGQPLADKLRALVCHDGVFSGENMVSSDEQYFPLREFGAPFWKNTTYYDMWDPARHTDKWSTPMLVIHSEKDYRLPISEGLAAFNVLQGKKIESRFLMFPDENHWVLNEENSLVWHTVVLNWINSFVGLPPYMDESELFPDSTNGGKWKKPKAAGGRR